jgi:PncC family amidohydrolase
MTEGTVAAGLEIRAAATAESLVRRLGGGSRTLALAESCTAGLVADLLARVSGASRVLWGSFVCYTAAAKIAMLGLDRERLARHGLVSGETAGDMALGALEKSGASLSAAVTGLAGPGDDGSGTALGTVWVALAEAGLSGAGLIGAGEFHFEGSRNEIRMRAALAVLEELVRICS